MSDSGNIMGISASEDDWDDSDSKAVRSVLFRLGVRHGHYGAPEDWRLFDQYAPLAVELRVAAKELAEAKGMDLDPVWNTMKMRLTQDNDEVIDGPIRVSNHHMRKKREAFAIAAEIIDSGSYQQRAELAKEIFLMHSDARTVDAWDAMNYEQLSLFEDVRQGSVADGTDKVKERWMTLVDETPTGRDPAQLSFLDAVLDEAGLSERVKDVASHLSDGTQPAEIARELGVSKQTVMRDMRLLKRYADGWINDLPWPRIDIEPDDDPDDDEGEHDGREVQAV